MSASIRRNLGQSLIIGIRGTTLTPDESKFISENNIGGVILFTRNYETPEQLLALCRDLQKLSQSMPDRVPLFISIDMEGGRVQRLKAPFTIWPSAKKLAALNSSSTVFLMAKALGTELFNIGINMNFAPCVDLLTNPQNTAIGDRSFGSDIEKVGKLASAFVRGLVKSDIIACAKHFPGHGNTIVDSHEELPVENLSLEEIEAREIQPFKRAFRARLDLVMTSHIKFPKIDPQWPCTLSSTFINDILRNKIRYRNLVVTDDMGMKAIANNFGVGEAAVRAYQAGCNLLLYCNEFDAPEKVMQSLLAATNSKDIDSNLVIANHKKILDLKKAKIKNFNIGRYSDIQHTIGSAEHKEIAQAIEEGRLPPGLEADDDSD